MRTTRVAWQWHVTTTRQVGAGRWVAGPGNWACQARDARARADPPDPRGVAGRGVAQRDSLGYVVVGNKQPAEDTPDPEQEEDDVVWNVAADRPRNTARVGPPQAERAWACQNKQGREEAHSWA